ncbi:MAG: hypothetical protein QOF51_4060 [Chloroflexota bacterium]|jgi:hypothetical protein|nr:hypothetical protein [Chloroflexota bacterium]
MRHWRIPALALSLATAFAVVIPLAAAQEAGPYRELTTIPIPTWANVDTTSFDIAWVNPATQTFFLADRTPPGGGIEVIDAANNTFVRTAGLGKMVGNIPSPRGGPNGVTAVSPVEVAAADGDSTVKIINIFTDEVQSISTGGENRADELAYDPTDDLLLVANPREDTPFVTVIKVHPLGIVGKILMPHASATGAGLEQPLAANGRFYISIQTTDTNPNGEIDLINPQSLTVERRMAAGSCKITGLMFGLGGRLVTGGNAECSSVVDPSSGSVAEIPNAGGDEVSYIPSMGLYAFGIAATNTLNLVDAATRQTVQKLPIGSGRNAAVNPVNGEIFVADGSIKAVRVFAPIVAPDGKGK